jgi:predicted ribosomally synthesized peptide with nif11-like leader
MDFLLTIMSLDQLDSLLAQASVDPVLEHRLMAAGADFNAFLAVSDEYGFQVAPRDLLALRDAENVELSADELRGVCGGAVLKLTRLVKSMPISISTDGLSERSGSKYISTDGLSE